MLGCNKCMGQINTKPNHCCYCDALSLGTSLGDQIQRLEQQNKNLEEQLEMWKDKFCELVKIRNRLVVERDMLLSQ